MIHKLFEAMRPLSKNVMFELTLCIYYICITYDMLSMFGMSRGKKRSTTNLCASFVSTPSFHRTPFQSSSYYYRYNSTRGLISCKKEKVV